MERESKEMARRDFEIERAKFRLSLVKNDRLVKLTN